METMLDKFGRIVIPKQVRDDLGLRPGEMLNIEEVEHEIILRPLHNESGVIYKDGVLVFSGASTEDIMKAVYAHREERSSNISHLKKK